MIVSTQLNLEKNEWNEKIYLILARRLSNASLDSTSCNLSHSVRGPDTGSTSIPDTGRLCRWLLWFFVHCISLGFRLVRHQGSWYRYLTKFYSKVVWMEVPASLSRWFLKVGAYCRLWCWLSRCCSVLLRLFYVWKVFLHLLGFYHKDTGDVLLSHS